LCLRRRAAEKRRRGSMACLQHSIEGYFIPAPRSEDVEQSEAPALFCPVPLEALPPSARLTLARLKTLRLAAAAMAVYFVLVMVVERNAEYLGSAVRGVEGGASGRCRMTVGLYRDSE